MSLDKAERKMGPGFKKIIESTSRFGLRTPCHLWPGENQSWKKRLRARLIHLLFCRTRDHRPGTTSREWQLKQKTVADR